MRNYFTLNYVGTLHSSKSIVRLEPPGEFSFRS